MHLNHSWSLPCTAVLKRLAGCMGKHTSFASFIDWNWPRLSNSSDVSLNHDWKASMSSQPGSKQFHKYPRSTAFPSSESRDNFNSLLLLSISCWLAPVSLLGSAYAGLRCCSVCWLVLNFISRHFYLHTVSARHSVFMPLSRLGFYSLASAGRHTHKKKSKKL